MHTNREPTTLEQLAEKYAIIYIDSCIMGHDYNLCDLSEKNGSSQKNTFCEKLGAAKRFSDVSLSILRRQYSYAQELAELVSTYHTMTMTPLILEEYHRFVLHLNAVAPYLRKRSTPTRGKKEELLLGCAKNHNHMYQLLKGRIKKEDTLTSLFAEYLAREKLHVPTDNLFCKKMGTLKEYPSPADCNIVAHAITHSISSQDPIIIITDGYDIVNLVRNYGDRMRNKQMLSFFQDFYDFSIAPIHVYFSSPTEWRKNFSVVHATQTRKYTLQKQKKLRERITCETNAPLILLS